MSQKPTLESLNSAAQTPKNPVDVLDWQEVYRRVRLLPKLKRCWGVPRGGAIVAGLTGMAVNAPEQADIIVDDIVDSGKTREKWRLRFPEKPFHALVDKTADDSNLRWVQFPWEEDPNKDAEDLIVRLLEHLGENPAREGLIATPGRVIKAWRELTYGYHQDPASVLSAQFDTDGYDEMVICRNVEFYSTCEHHLLPFSGVAHIAYIPSGKIVGLSKMARLVDMFARRLQVQERLTRQIADTMQTVLNPVGVGVVVQAKHLCMSCRGVQKHQAQMVTSALTGCFRKPEVRAEFLELIRS